MGVKAVVALQKEVLVLVFGFICIFVCIPLCMCICFVILALFAFIFNFVFVHIFHSPREVSILNFGLVCIIISILYLPKPFNFLCYSGLVILLYLFSLWSPGQKIIFQSFKADN